MMARNTTLFLAGSLLLGCYTGVTGRDPGADAAGDDAGATGDASDEEGGADEGGDDADVDVSPSALARLTRLEYERTVTAIFGEALVAEANFDALPADGRIGRFESNADLDVNIDSVDAYRLVAEDIDSCLRRRPQEFWRPHAHFRQPCRPSRRR